jgi:hypothetical protein
MSSEVSTTSTVRVLPIDVRPAQMSTAQMSPERLHEQAVRARNELVDTLDALEAKLNLPRRFKRRMREITGNLSTLGTENPAALGAVALGALTVVGALVWAGVRAAQRR